MAVKISVPIALEKKIRDLVESGPVMEHAATTVRQLIALLDDAHDKRTRKAENSGGLDPKDVIKTIKSVLGGKAYCPPNPGVAFYGFIKKRTQFLNVSIQDIEQAAVHVRSHWKLPTSVEWIIRRLDQILEEKDRSEEIVPDGERLEWELVTGRD
jgi:hypothetical protein